MKRRKHRIHVFILAAAMAAFASNSIEAIAQSQNACAGASLVNPESILSSDTGRGGMGGTGVVAEEGKAFAGLIPETGGMGGTGIVGVITGFASICVNGEEIDYDDATRVSINGRRAHSRELSVGQLVVVRAEPGAGRLRATGLAVIDAVAGPVSRIDAGAGTLHIMGQIVRSEAALAHELARISAGASVRVSGHRLINGEIVATRVDLAPEGAPDSTYGSITRIDSEGFTVNGTRVAVSGGTLPPGIRPGVQVFVSGDWNGSVLSANRVQFQPVREAIARVDKAIIEGFVYTRMGNDLNVGGLSISMSDNTQVSGGSVSDAETGRKVRLEFRRSGARGLIAERIDIRREIRVLRGAPEFRGAEGEQDRNAGPGGRNESSSSDSGGQGGDDSGRGTSVRPNSPSRSDSLDRGSGRDRSGVRIDSGRPDTPPRPDFFDRGSGGDRSGPRLDSGSSGSGRSGGR